jgi:hypothetical protein
MYCDLWPREFKIEETFLLLVTLQYTTGLKMNQQKKV